MLGVSRQPSDLPPRLAIVSPASENRRARPQAACAKQSLAPNAVVEPIHPKATPGDPDERSAMLGRGMKRRRYSGLAG